MKSSLHVSQSQFFGMMNGYVGLNVCLGQIEKIDIEISNLISDRNVKKIKEHFHTLSESGGFSVPGVWSLKNKFGFKSLDRPG